MSAAPAAARRRGRRAAVVYIFKNAFGGADAFAPVAQHLKHRFGDRVVLDAIFLDAIAREEVESSAFHLRLFEETTHVHDWTGGPGGGPVRRGWKLLRLVALLIRRRLATGRLAVLYTVTGSSPLEALLMRIFDLLGTHYHFPGTQTPWNRTYSDRMKPDHYARMLATDGAKRNRVIRRQPRNVICYLADEVELMERYRSWRSRYHPIGLPRLYSSWREAVARIGGPILEDELRALGLDPATPRIATIVLTATEYIWFDSRDEFLRLLDEAVAAIRSQFADLPILLKAKPAYLRKGFYTGLEEHCDDPRIRLTTCALSVLASRSALAVAINETSGIFDFVLSQVPCIEHGSYNKAWLDIYGSKTAWAGTPGFVFTESREALDAAVRSVREGTFPVRSGETFASHFGHVEDLSVFVGTLQAKGAAFGPGAEPAAENAARQGAGGPRVSKAVES